MPIEVPENLKKWCPIMSKMMPIPDASLGGMAIKLLKADCQRQDCELWDGEQSQCGLKETKKCPTNT